MAQLNIEILTEKIDKLIAHCRHLQLENQTLKDTQRVLSAEVEALSQKQAIAKQKVESLLQRLKVLET